jgi:hypothetical protein
MCQCEACTGARDFLALLAAVEREDDEAIRVIHAHADRDRMLVAATSYLAHVLADAGTDPAWWAGSLLEQDRGDHAEA